MKKIVLIIFLSLLFFSFLPNLVQAKDADWCKDIPLEDRTGGFVPCGRDCDDPTTSKNETASCKLCDIFVMLDGILDFLLLRIVPVLAALMIAIGGGMYILSQGKPEMLSRAKSLFTAIAIGLIIIYGAWALVNLFLMTIGVADWTGLKTWWEIDCP